MTLDEYIIFKFPVEEHEKRLYNLQQTMQDVHRQVANYKLAKKNGTLKPIPLYTLNSPL